VLFGFKIDFLDKGWYQLISGSIKKCHSIKRKIAVIILLSDL